jgi:NADH:ubiquinone reductase (H+-translocating)
MPGDSLGKPRKLQRESYHFGGTCLAISLAHAKSGSMETRQARVVVLGAGFGGLSVCKALNHPGAHITLVDRQNHHLFQPLLYQVATAGLAAPDIAQPIRSILHDHPHLTVVMDSVEEIRLSEKRVILKQETLDYDYLVLALGGVTSYFGHAEWEAVAPGLKTLDDAVKIRREILLAFEKAETAKTREERERLMTIVVVGGGPTGVELAGAFAELSRHVLVRDFRHIDPSRARIVLIEASPVILSHLTPELAASGQRQLERMGVEIRTNTRVTAITQGCVETSTGRICAENIIWAAGVGASPLTKNLGVPIDRAGRIKVLPDLSVPGFPNVFAVGDIASLVDANGVLVPGVSPAAMQEGRHVARIIRDELNGERTTRPAFAYFDKGTMATIGRSAAVAKIGDFEISGFIAWMAWLFVHLIFLIGFRNKVSVLFQWLYSYLTYRRGSRIITGLSFRQPPSVTETTRVAINPAPQSAPSPAPAVKEAA